MAFVKFLGLISVSKCSCLTSETSMYESFTRQLKVVLVVVTGSRGPLTRSTTAWAAHLALHVITAQVIGVTHQVPRQAAQSFFVDVGVDIAIVQESISEACPRRYPRTPSALSRHESWKAALQKFRTDLDNVKDDFLTSRSGAKDSPQETNL